MFSWNQLLDNLKVDQITHEKETGLYIRYVWQTDKSLNKIPQSGHYVTADHPEKFGFQNT